MHKWFVPEGFQINTLTILYHNLAFKTLTFFTNIVGLILQGVNVHIHSAADLIWQGVNGLLHSAADLI